MAEARRTLVKSPPELWAEVSDPESLARHLGAFGEIRITRTEPETTVAWEGDRARGTVELEASGWGTKVRLTAEAVEVEEEPALQQPLSAEEEPPASAAPPVEVEPAAEEQPATAATPAAVEEEPPPVEKEPPPIDEPAIATAPPVEEEPADEETPKRRGFFARLFGRRRELRVTTITEGVAPLGEPAAVEEPAAPVAAAEEPAAVEEPEPPAAAAEEPAAVEEPGPPAAAAEEPAAVEEPAPPAAPASPEATAPDQPEAPAMDEPEGEIRVSRLGDDEAAEVLAGVLDTLGAAHHRPFSRS